MGGAGVDQVGEHQEQGVAHRLHQLVRQDREVIPLPTYQEYQQISEARLQSNLSFLPRQDEDTDYISWRETCSSNTQLRWQFILCLRVTVSIKSYSFN